MLPLRDMAILLCVTITAICAPELVAAQTSQDASSDTSVQDRQNNGEDFTRPVNSLELRLRYQRSIGSDSTTEREVALLRVTSRIDLDPWWKISLYAETQGADKTTVSDKSPSTHDIGFGDSVLQGVMIRKLNEDWAFGFGSRVVAPTADDNLGTRKWQIMPGFGVRYSLTALGSDSYFVPSMRYAVSVAGTPSTRDISELQIAPTLNIDLSDRWFFTLYPSYDIRINYGDPITGQKGQLFLPADFAVGQTIDDHVVMSLEVSVPMIKDYPVYDFKTQLRLIFKN